MSVLTPSAILGPDGALAARFDAYEQRPQQLAMAELVDQAMTAHKHAVVEAPTGVGKSLAYLAPAARYALEQRKKVVISTNTIALQEQLVHKDIPLVQELFPGLQACLVKGRQNYISLRRLAHALTGQQALFDNSDQVDELKSIASWSSETEFGDRADLGYDPHPATWRTVQSDRNNCLGRRCPHYDECFFYRARKELEDADLMIVNHHLFFSDLALREEHAAILPAYDVVIFDEAHSLEDVATEHLGLSVSEAQIRYYLDGLWNNRGKGLLSASEDIAAQDAVEQARQAAVGLWRDVAMATIDSGDETFKITTPDRFANPLSPALERLADAIERSRGSSEDDNAAQELRAQGERALGFAGSVRSFLEQRLDDYVYYATVPTGRGSINLSANPLSVAGLLRERLFENTKSVILTSATLAADDSERFLFLRKRIGLDECEALRLDSPFDYQKQARLLINESTLDPNSERFEQSLAQWLGDFIDDAPGGTFILFTSYRQMDRVHALLRPRLERARRFVLRQGGDMGRSQMLELFKSTGNAVLFGTSSFWEGVDVRGDALQNVVIVKLPFEVPDHPLIEARHHDIKRRGGNPFMERTVPEAILRLKQGVGRLIRTASDRGTIVLCDHRVLTKQYGRWFLRALPDMPTEHFRLDS